MLTVVCILAVTALVTTLVAMAWSKIPWYVPVLLIAIVQVLSCLPLR